MDQQHRLCDGEIRAFAWAMDGAGTLIGTCPDCAVTVFVTRAHGRPWVRHADGCDAMAFIVREMARAMLGERETPAAAAQWAAWDAIPMASSSCR